MSIQTSDNFIMGVKKFLDTRQKVDSIVDLEAADKNLFPGGYIVYCENQDAFYQFNEVDLTWNKLNLDISEYLYEKDNQGLPDLTKPKYSKEEFMNILGTEFVQSIIDDGYIIDPEDEFKFYFIDDSTTGQQRKTYSSEIISKMANEYYEEFKIKADEDMERLENIIYKKVDSIYDMDRNDVFYLIENDAVLGTFKIYVYDDENGASELGTSEMEITGFQMLADLDLKTTNKFIVDAINETNTNAQKLDKLIGIMENLILADVEDLYTAQQANYEKCLDLGKISELTTIDKKTAVSAINELYNEVGLLEDLNTPSTETIIDSLNSFVTSLIPPGTVLPYAGLIPPNGFLLCDGSTYNTADYPFLVKALKSDNYILTTFKVPDFRGKTFYQYYIPNANWGSRNASVSLSNIAAHHHGPTSEYSHSHYGYTGSTYDASGECSSDGDGGDIIQKDGTRLSVTYNTSDTKHRHEMTFSTHSHTHTVTYHDTLTEKSSGVTVTYHNNVQPYIGLNFIIKY